MFKINKDLKVKNSLFIAIVTGAYTRALEPLGLVLKKLQFMPLFRNLAKFFHNIISGLHFFASEFDNPSQFIWKYTDGLVRMEKEMRG